MSPFESVLIANRGEIARRVIRTCRTLGIRTIAVYSDADANAPHVHAADEAVRLGPSPVTDSYLNMQAVLDAARQTDAAAIHPGYGFLSENALFAKAVGAAGITWIGPPPDAIRLMGDKATAKALMAQVGIPVVPGFDTTAMHDSTIAHAIAELGYPVLLKAAAGGGGKGMRPVHCRDDLAEALIAARREAAGAFGDERLIVEKLIERPRHIEVQIFADTYGNVVHLFERECSIQRRHQKIVEETPSPGVDPNLRERLGAAAIEVARAVDYIGAGTVEFIVAATPDTHSHETPQHVQTPPFYFLEMNTRLQVEHPVTELVTGVDLVAWQLKIAAGQPLPVSQENLSQQGHAIEVRLYAEDPANGFLPQTGTLERFDAPTGPGIRIDSGVETGTDVSRFYDPMLAKLIVHAPDRNSAIRRLRALLYATVVHGITTNLAHLADTIAHPAFAAGDLDTGFLNRFLPEWQPADATSVELAAVAAVLAGPLNETGADPWETLGPWRLANGGGTVIRLAAGEIEHVVTVRQQRGRLTVAHAEHHYTIDAVIDDTVVVDGTPVALVLTRTGSSIWAHVGGRTHRWQQVLATGHVSATELSGPGTLTSPMPGVVLDLRVTQGDSVSAGDVLVIVEAMKMEHRVTAPADGVVSSVHVVVGAAVQADAPLLTFELQDV
ncbi:MAG: biotin carboxylase N-terminal domain-containing protein [Nitriliruptoraceae bacterium]